MLETNIRVVRPGPQLYVPVRRVIVSGQTLAPDLLERLCNLLRRRYGISAARIPGSMSELFVATDRQVEKVTLEEDNWQLTAVDSNDPTRRLFISNTVDESFISILIERALLAQIASRSLFWALDSPRILYEQNPFQRSEGVAVYHRYEVDALSLGDTGIGISVDVSTAFFSEHTLEYYFDPNLVGSESKTRQDEFHKFTGRQVGQKGTLLYNNGRSKVKCYFENNRVGLTCGATGQLKLDGITYPSLYHYYASKFSTLQIKENDAAVQVSFPGLDRPVSVAARLLSLRVMNDDVPDSLSSVDKIPPNHRKSLIEQFWKCLEPRPLGNIAPGLFDGFWRPNNERVHYIQLPEIKYGQGNKIESPDTRSIVSIKNYFKRRLELLGQAGCYHFPPSAPRTIYCAYPQSLGEDIPEKLVNGIVNVLDKWTGLSFCSTLVSYSTASEAYGKLRRAESAGVVLFVLDEEPAAYYDASFNLEGWRVKRVTEPVLRQQYKYLTNGVWDKKRLEYSLGRGQSRWESFITLIGLDVIQQLDAIPYRVSNIGPYEGQLIIDVGHDRQFFAVSLLIVRSEDKVPAFNISSQVQHKADHKHESINPVLLKDTIINVFKTAIRRAFDPLTSLLIMRDGNVQGNEVSGIDNALTELQQLGIISPDARVDIVGVHKGSASSIRLWDVDGRGEVTNAIEGTGLSVNSSLYLVACTGEATLTQGTAEPVAIVGNNRCLSIGDAALSAFLAAQLNWSSPGVAQRLPLPLKRTDEELAARSDQEIRRIR